MKWKWTKRLALFGLIALPMGASGGPNSPLAGAGPGPWLIGALGIGLCGAVLGGIVGLIVDGVVRAKNGRR
jgi:hypothetical protein